MEEKKKRISYLHTIVRFDLNARKELVRLNQEMNGSIHESWLRN